MEIVLVHARVKPDSVQAFIEATQKNAENSLNEKGVVRFEVLQSADDPAHFILVEAYRENADRASHKETAHYLEWKKVVEGYMAETRKSEVFTAVYPAPDQWK